MAIRILVFLLILVLLVHVLGASLCSSSVLFLGIGSGSTNKYDTMLNRGPDNEVNGGEASGMDAFEPLPIFIGVPSSLVCHQYSTPQHHWCAISIVVPNIIGVPSV